MRQEFSSNPKFGLLKDLKIGVLSGGASSERKISLKSGKAVNLALKRAGFPTLFIDPKYPEQMNRNLRRVDIAFIALHGKGGEDGTIQSLLEKQGIPYIGSDTKGSRRAFDKVVAKKIFLKKGIPTPPSTVVNARNWKSRLSKFPMPAFVKPLREGSSIGAFAIEDLSQNAENLKRAVRRYETLLVERQILGREFTVGVLGTNALPVIELKPKNAFYDYRAKYTKGMTEYVVPARIPAALTRKMQKLAVRAHQALGLRDFSRTDFMVDEKNRPYALEVNSIPGFTELSLLPKAARAKGISFEDLCTRLVSWAYERGKKNKIFRRR